MVYIAKHYVSVNGRMYSPGEVFSEDIPKQKEEWLISKGAIEPTGCTAQEVFEENGISEDEISDTEDRSDWEKAETEELETEEPETEEPEEAPEIDVMDGICAPEEPEEPEVPKKRRGRK